MRHLFLLTAAIAAAGLIGLGADELVSGSSPLRLEAGVSLGILLRFGPAWWPIVFLGLAALSPFQVVPLHTSIAWAAIGTAQAVVIAHALRSFADPGTRLTPRPLLAALGLVAGVCALGATLSTVALETGGFLDPASRVTFCGTWWIGDLSGSLLIAPFFWWLLESRRTERAVEHLALAGGAAVAAWAAHAALGGGAFALLPLPIAILGGWRLGYGATGLVLLFTALATAGALTVHGVVLDGLTHWVGESISLNLVGVAGLAAAALRHRGDRAEPASPPVIASVEIRTTVDIRAPEVTTDDTARVDSEAVPAVSTEATPGVAAVAGDGSEPDLASPFLQSILHEVRKSTHPAARPEDPTEEPTEEPTVEPPPLPAPSTSHAIDIDGLVNDLRDELAGIVGADQRLVIASAASTVHSSIDAEMLGKTVTMLVTAASRAASSLATIAVRSDLVATEQGVFLQLEASEESRELTNDELMKAMGDDDGDAEAKPFDLSTLHRLVDPIGGRIAVSYSRIDFGVSYSAIIPIQVDAGAAVAATEPASTVTPADPPSPGKITRSPTVVVCEPNQRVREQTEEALWKLDVSIQNVASPGEALTYAKDSSRAIDLAIIADLFPDRTGIDLARELRASVAGLPVILTGAHDAPPEIAAAIDAEDGLSWLKKPFQPDELTHEVVRLMGVPEPRLNTDSISVDDLLKRWSLDG